MTLQVVHWDCIAEFCCFQFSMCFDVKVLRVWISGLFLWTTDIWDTIFWTQVHLNYCIFGLLPFDWSIGTFKFLVSSRFRHSSISPEVLNGLFSILGYLLNIGLGEIYFPENYFENQRKRMFFKQFFVSLVFEGSCCELARLFSLLISHILSKK